jgi:uncharacterized protein (TIGR03435 family)
MFAKSLLPHLVFAVPFAFGQIGLYGPVTYRPHAGEVAPYLRFDKVLNSPGGASWSQSNFAGQLTVIAFFPNTSLNLQQVTLWNATVNKFAGESVQFVWITGEREPTLLPWLEQHPVEGWVLRDSEGRTGHAYGMELPVQVLVGADSKIIGFFHGTEEIEGLVRAAQEGRITTTRPSQATLRAFIESKLVLVDSEAPRMPRAEDHRPSFPPSYTVHISPSQGDESGNFSSDDFWSLQGLKLIDAIAFLYDVNSIRIQIPPSFDDGKRYDLSLVLPEQESQEQMKDRMRAGLQDYFHLDVRRENRLVDVYVLTVAQEGKLVPFKPSTNDGMGRSRASGIQFEAPASLDDALAGMKPQPVGAIRGVFIDDTADVFCHRLESTLDRPVVNETNLQGEFAFRVESSADAENNFPQHLRQQLGLVISPAQRNVEFLMVEPR